jgi:hypothetical protein
MYLVEREDVYDERCLAYEFFHHIKQLNNALKSGPNSEIGKQVRSEIKGEILVDLYDFGDNITVELERLRAIVDHPRYAAVKSAYETLKPRPKHWHAMKQGPTNIESLVRALRRLGHYHAMYRYWSGFAHGENALKRAYDTGEQLQMDPTLCVRRRPQPYNSRRMLCARRSVSGLKSNASAYWPRNVLPHGCRDTIVTPVRESELCVKTYWTLERMPLDHLELLPRSRDL